MKKGICHFKISSQGSGGVGAAAVHDNGLVTIWKGGHQGGREDSRGVERGGQGLDHTRMNGNWSLMPFEFSRTVMQR